MADNEEAIGWQSHFGPFRRVVRGRKGGLKDMPYMPMDILVEIFSLMHPRDLLNLARTTKAFRAVLMSRSSAPYWKAARREVDGLPQCPPYLSEPAYANLLFFPHCHFCFKNNIQNIFFEFSARYCRDCQRHMLVVRMEVWDVINDIIRDTGVQDEFINTVFITRASEGKSYYHRPEYEELLQACHPSRPIEQQRQYVMARALSVSVIEETCPELYAWKDVQIQNRAEELDMLRSDRFSAILDFLREEGWAAELDLMEQEDFDKLADQPYARKPMKLTKRGWSSIQADAHTFMEDVREARLQSERRSLLIDRIATFAQILEETDLESQVRTAEWELKPHLADLVLLSSVRNILDDPDDEQLPSETVTFFRDNIQAIRNHWYDSIRDKLTHMFCEAVTLHGDTDCLLDLAIAAFSCKLCGKEVPLRFPSLLAHPCFRPGSLYTWRGELYTTTISEIASILKVPDAFVLDEVSVDRTAVEEIRAIVEACGLDPLCATQEDLERCETRLYCAGCQTEDEDGWIQVPACDWLSAYLHGKYQHRRSGRAPQWRVLPESTVNHVKALEILRSRPDEIKHYNRCCVYCRFSSPRRESMKMHLETSHEITVNDEELDQFFYVRPDDRTQPLPFIYLCFQEGAFKLRLQRGWRHIG